MSNANRNSLEAVAACRLPYAIVPIPDGYPAPTRTQLMGNCSFLGIDALDRILAAPFTSNPRSLRLPAIDILALQELRFLLSEIVNRAVPGTFSKPVEKRTLESFQKKCKIIARLVGWMNETQQEFDFTFDLNWSEGHPQSDRFNEFKARLTTAIEADTTLNARRRRDLCISVGQFVKLHCAMKEVAYICSPPCLGILTRENFASWNSYFLCWVNSYLKDFERFPDPQLGRKRFGALNSLYRELEDYQHLIESLSKTEPSDHIARPQGRAQSYSSYLDDRTSPTNRLIIATHFEVQAKLAKLSFPTILSKCAVIDHWCAPSVETLDSRRRKYSKKFNENRLPSLKIQHARLSAHT